MRDMPEHEKETERARHGHSLTLHVDIVTLCGSERQTREEQWLRNEAAAGGLAVHWVLGVAGATVEVVDGKTKHIGAS